MDSVQSYLYVKFLRWGFSKYKSSYLSPECTCYLLSLTLSGAPLKECSHNVSYPHEVNNPFIREVAGVSVISVVSRNVRKPLP